MLKSIGLWVFVGPMEPMILGVASFVWARFPTICSKAEKVVITTNSHSKP